MRKIKYSKDTDTLLIDLSDKKIDHAEEQGQVIIHFSENNVPVLIEIMDASDNLGMAKDRATDLAELKPFSTS